MIKVGIADDEPLVLAGLKSMLCMCPDVEILFEATNGKKTLDMIEETTPDIVITDIKMPAMTGLELIKYSKAAGYHTDFIVVSSYDEFKLAQEALHVGACGYLIKLEITSESLEESIREVYEKQIRAKGRSVSQVDAINRDMLRGDIVQRLFNRQQTDFDMLRRDMGQAQMQVYEGNMAVLFIGVEAYAGREKIDVADSQKLLICVMEIIEDVIKRYFSGYAVSLNLLDIAVLCSSDRAEGFMERMTEACDKMKKLTDSYFSLNLLMGVSSVVHGYEEIALAFDQARKAYKKGFYHEGQEINFYEQEFDMAYSISEKKLLPPEMQKEFIYALEIRNIEKTEQIFSRVIQSIKTEHPEREQAIDVCMKMCYLISSVVMEGNVIVENACGGVRVSAYAYQHKSIASILEWLKRLEQEVVSSFGVPENGQISVVIIDAKKYIKEHLESKFSLDDVAQFLNISSGYLSSAFKKQTNMGFSDYVTAERIVRAQELLAVGTYKVYEVAWKLGFDNQYYFSKVFKKTTGKTPSEFVESVRK